MTNVKNFLEKATTSIQDAYPYATDVRLEEFDRDSKSIVISYLLPDTNPIKGFGMTINGRAYERIYKTIVFDKQDEVASVKIYQK